MARQQLHVAQRATGVMGEPGRAGNERSPARMGRTAVETDEPVGIGKPDHNTLCRHWPAPLRHDHWANRLGDFVTERVSAGFGEQQEVFEIAVR